MWPTAVQNLLDANTPIRHHWAFHVWAKEFTTNAIVKRGVWTGSFNLSIDFADGKGLRAYDAAGGGLSLAPIRYRVGNFVMVQEATLAVTPETLATILGYNTTNAPMDLYCMIYRADTMQYIGARRFFKGYLDGSRINQNAQGEVDSMTVRYVSQMRKGEWLRTGKKSHESQKQRLATDEFRKYSSIGTQANDPWGITDED